MLQKILKTKSGYDLTAIRVVLGIVIFAHGAQKMLGIFGGNGWNGTMQFLSGTMHMSYITSVLTIFIEFFGSLMLIAGFFTRIAALGMFGLFAGIIYYVAFTNGFFMNWGGNNSGEGYEYDILVLGMSLALLIGGAGSLSIDSKLSSTKL
ncbi:MAG: DoxX family protein [Bacteroidia bacterium]